MTAEEEPRAERDRKLFDHIATEYAAKDLYEPARRARRLRLLQTIRTAYTDPTPKVMEVGCGAGYSAEYLEGHYGLFVGVDYSYELVQYANVHNRRNGVIFHNVNFFDVATPHQFDLLFMIGVLHHMEDIRHAVAHAAKLLRPGGHFTVNEPQATNPVIQGMRWVRGMIDPSYSKDQRQLNQAELTDALEAGGFTGIEVFSQGYFSTPFAEIALKPGWLFGTLSAAACSADAALESSVLERILRPLAWNLVVTGRKP